uniref:SFRICE_027710 n=1 Tax=Spodoptera frugiperda TaxID=7108 RepID=A0A2H1WJW8_SPOFR
MCWWLKVSVPLIYNLGARVATTVVDQFYHVVHCLTDVVAETNDDHPSEESEADSHKAESTPSEDTARKWPEPRKSGGTNMADRPLPVPVENEPYYMNVDRAEAINLLKGQPDGTFILRPSSQPDHAYTLSVACSNAVHNVGVRRRPDGRLALGFPRRGEQSFVSVTSLLRHHRKRRLLLVSGGDVIGATTLNETPHYYQSPSSIPVPVAN